MLVSQYDYILVVVSFIVAILASYTALNMAGRVTSSSGTASWVWLSGGGVAMGIGIWAMHFIGMLAMNISMSMLYDPFLTALSMVIAIGSSLFALWLVSGSQLHLQRLIPGAIIMGLGIVAMHYTGMAALQVSPAIVWNMNWVALSVVIAMAASFAALWLTFRLRHEGAQVALMRFGAAILMGIAIAGMHYTGMMAAQFPPQHATGHHGFNNNWLVILVSMMAFSVLGITLLVSMFDARLQVRTSLLAASLAAANRELARLALHDTLTRLPNRVLLEDRLEQAINKARREGSFFALMFMDLDGFKTVNDAWGHDVGDKLLVAVTDRLRQPLKGQYTLARIGGDEFVLLAEVNAPDEAATLANALVRAIDKPFNIDPYDVIVTLSVGIALYPHDGKNERELMFNADAAMYHTKHMGRNGYHFFQPSMNTLAQTQLQLLNDLWLALERQEFRLVYQPKFKAPSGPVIGFEALLRWHHPFQGVLSPEVFLPLAEKTGLIIPLGNWVVDEACRQLSEWRKQGHLEWSIAVNLSTMQFEQNGLVQTILDALKKHDVPPEKLILEVTETTAMSNPDESVRVLTELTNAGVQASIDDFGTGYSSLLYLKRLPACELKIDRAFVRELCKEGEDATIVSAIVALAKTLNLKVVAEGVETEEQQAFLTELGCNTLQGYLLGKPVSAESITAYGNKLSPTDTFF
ncbi:UNVERIFIED_ORG: diguanylate cyclase (GGDEF)-like protein [Kosakonia oryzae]|uniref:Diguanylate cyclase (GGDEF) domain-containing protein n=1 Tax=Kosakonia radicincitans TaxID=283686 RepID=A0AAX2EU08_9ENTR|nr:bifunctional diguanylate cyclase/phosphodiesterase [Kosakonia radicincitans]MDP9565376.1 diguanylate cyclase (GGDEF)-like protein [Kosakonia oryzae]SFE36696.1 diguanylate cyclase (GGDEF) domain-containing protein [Kosakonia radicincitans]SFR18179.1 diguanylate cyclase (GGDEF) domain-containing protein [Kosakonia radicincitans]SFT75034.1 diguanylate cyclase (GGDEF) domain-containing protein [Kosakonia radicincitans]SFX56416.1 diguanylate cyclase (GGDEF) domain-containing protein [Kosakonia r